MDPNMIGSKLSTVSRMMLVVPGAIDRRRDRNFTKVFTFGLLMLINALFQDLAVCDSPTLRCL